jgi:hypothetical protein
MFVGLVIYATRRRTGGAQSKTDFLIRIFPQLGSEGEL